MSDQEVKPETTTTNEPDVTEKPEAETSAAEGDTTEDVDKVLKNKETDRIFASHNDSASHLFLSTIRLFRSMC